MVIHCMEMAHTSSMCEAVISQDAVQKARIIMNYVIEQKFALMPPEIKIAIAPPISSPINTGSDKLDKNTKYLSKFLTFKSAEIQPSQVSQFRLMPPTPTSSSRNKYPVDECKAFMGEVSTAGFGSVFESQREGSKKKAFTFRKRPYNSLGSEQKETLTKLRLTEELYNASFSDDSFGSGGTVDLLSTPDSQKSSQED